MTYPDSLPWVVEYRVGCTVRSALPRRSVQARGNDGATDAAVVCPLIPVGADAWRLPTETGWRPLAELPPEWRPFLQRSK